MDERKNLKVSLGTVICMFIIFVLILALITVYYLGFVKNNENISDLTNNNQNYIVENDKTETKNDVVNNSTNIESIDISVVDAVNYVDSYYKLFKVRLPKIIGNTTTVEALNSKILNEVLPLTYTDVADYTSTNKISFDKGTIHDYSHVIKNNILIIHIYSSVPEGGSTLPSSGDGLHSYSYYYDITNDKILSLSEAADKLELSLSGIITEDGKAITSYNDLEKNGYSIIINNNELKLKFSY